jgi:hypothetical protein
LLFAVASSPKTLVNAAVDAAPFHPPTMNRAPKASQITRVTSLPFLNIAVAAVLACRGGAIHAVAVASVE